MPLNSDLISQFVKLTTQNNSKTQAKDTTVYGTIQYDGSIYSVLLDGAEQSTPIIATSDVKAGDRVAVTIRNHTATVTGNLTSPAARTEDVKELGNDVKEVGTVISHTVTTDNLQAINGYFDTLTSTLASVGKLEAVEAEIAELKAKYIEADKLKVDDINAITGRFESLKATFGEFNDLEVDVLTALNATIDELTAYTASFTHLTAVNADIKELTTVMIDAETGKFKFLEADLANITMAELKKIFSDYGVIDELISSDGTFTKQLVGVTVSGDLIEGNTIKADKLLLRDPVDGLYYQMNIGSLEKAEDGAPVIPEAVTEEDIRNGLLGNIIVANSITAEKLRVDDLVAFNATIAGFKMTKLEEPSGQTGEPDEPEVVKRGAIYSGVKNSIENTTQGIYLDSEGQMALGDGHNSIKYYKTAEDGYKLNIAVDDIQISGKNNISDLLNSIRIDPNEPSIRIGAGKESMSLSLRNDVISFEKNGTQFGWWDGINFHTGNVVVDVTERAQFGNYAMVPRSDGSLSFLKVTDNTGFYAYIGGGVITLYGTYPTLEDTTLVISDVSGELDGTTLILGGN